MQRWCERKTKLTMIWWLLFLVPLPRREKQNEASSLFTATQARPIQHPGGEKSQPPRTSLYIFHFLSAKNWQTKQERILYKKWQDQNWLFLCCYSDLIRLPLTDINGWEEATQKNTYGRTKKWTSANKSWRTCTELWQLIKALAPNGAVINYAEGSIVRFLPSSSSDHRKI